MKFRILCAIIVAMLACGACSARDWEVADNGAVADATTDNTAAIQKALDEAGKAGGGVVNIPAGRFRVLGNLSIPGGVTLQGSFRTAPFVQWDQLENTVGTVLLAYAGRGSNDGPPFIKLAGYCSTLAGIMVEYPEWKRSDVPPVPYPPCVASDGTDNVTIQDCNFVNPYEGIRLHYAHRHLIRNVQGYPIWRGLYIDECYDVGRVENIHFWPFGIPYFPTDPFSDWISKNGTAFEFARTDWQYVSNAFCFGYGVGYKFSESAHGPCNGSFVTIGADSCRRPIMVEQANDFGLLITNGEFVGRWEGQDAVGVEIGPKVVGKVSLFNCSFWGPFDKCLWQRSPTSQLTAIGCNFVAWDIAKIGSPAIGVDAGKTIIQGNTFKEGDLHVSVAKGVASALISTNQADGGLIVKNLAGARTVSIGNQGPPVVLTQSQKAFYTMPIGATNDGQFVRRWYGREPGNFWNGKGTMRWSGPNAEIVLPVIPGKAYKVTLDMSVPKPAMMPGAGIYVGATKVAGFKRSGNQMATGLIPASKTSEVVLQIKCRNWKPVDNEPNNRDTRDLGVAVHTVTMKAVGATGRTPYDASSLE